MNKELNQKVADKLEYEIDENFPLNDTYNCPNCGHGVYIMHFFENLTDIIIEQGIEEFIKWFKELEIEINNCDTCYCILFFNEEYPEEAKLVKDWILRIIENEIK